MQNVPVIGGSFVVHKTFLELLSKTVLQHSLKQLEYLGTYFMLYSLISYCRAIELVSLLMLSVVQEHAATLICCVASEDFQDSETFVENDRIFILGASLTFYSECLTLPDVSENLSITVINKHHVIIYISNRYVVHILELKCLVLMCRTFGRK